MEALRMTCIIFPHQCPVSKVLAKGPGSQNHKKWMMHTHVDSTVDA